MKIKIVLKILLVCYLLFMLGFSFKRYYYLTLDGDLPAIVLPVLAYQPVMNDPFGMNVLLHDSIYAATNRYFAHATIMAYFKSVPIWLQKFFNPIESVYIAAALVRVFTQFFLVYLIACYATRKKRIWDLDFLLAASICMPLFQLYRFYAWMAVIDSSVTYTFFYAFSMSLVMLYFLPFYNASMGRRDFNFSLPLKIFLLLFTIFISLNGPLNVPVILMIICAVLLNYFIINFRKLKTYSFVNRLRQAIRNIPSSMLSLFLFAILVGMYSLYIGKFNFENFRESTPIAERYSRLWAGFVHQYTFKLAQPVLIGMVVVNSIIIYFLKPDEEASKMMKMLRWFAVLSVIYILLLPLGGFRIYRPNILRWDTIMPITLGLMIFYTYTTVYILKNTRKYNLLLCSVLFLGVSIFYIHSDWGLFKFNMCEQKGLNIIAESDERVVQVEPDCSILSWGKIKTPAESKMNSEMLLYWNIINEQKLYWQK